MTDDAALSGSLNFLNLGDLLQLFGSNASNGVLRIYSDHSPEPGVIYLKKGNPINAYSGSKVGLDALYALFGWLSGEFRFTQQDVTEEPTIQKSRMEIILDGLRMLDDGEIEKIGPPSDKPEDGEATADQDGIPLIKGPLVDYMYIVDEEEYSDGSEIVTENKHGNWLWVVVEGVVQVFKDTPNGRMEIVRVTDGAFIGSLATFTVNANPRSATSVARGNVSLGVLDIQRLFTEFSNLSRNFQKFLLSMDRRLREITDRVVELRTGPASLDAWVKGRKPVIRQGKPEKRLFMIAEGDATIVRHNDDGYIPLARLNRGDFFGTVPFFDLGHEPASASVLASPELKIAQLDAEAFLSEYESLTPTFKKLIEHTVNCMSVTTRLACEARSTGEPG